MRQVGHGGEAQLWYAELDVAGGAEPVAVKILRADRMAEFEQTRARWSEQAELLRFLTHPGVVTVREHFDGLPMHRAGERPDTGRALYLVMNWVNGPNLRDWALLNQGTAGLLSGLNYLAQTAAVLDWLHSGEATPSGRPVIHGDISPANILVTESGQAVLVDFGLVRMAAHHTQQPFLSPGYAAPEVWQGEYSVASDRYAFGAVTYFLLTGTEPPSNPQEIYAGLVAVPLIAALGQDVVNPLMAMFDPNPAVRPPASDWIRLLRSATTTSAAATVRMPAGNAALAAAATEDAAPKRRKGKIALIAAAVVAILAIAGGAFAAANGSKPHHNTASDTTKTSLSPSPGSSLSTAPTASATTSSGPPTESTPPLLSSAPDSTAPSSIDAASGAASSSPSAPPAPLSIEWSFSAANATAGNPEALTYTSTGGDSNTQLVLQRPVGTDQVWTTVAQLSGGKGAAPAMDIGSYQYRIAAVDASSDVIAASDAKTLRYFGSVPLSALLGTTTNTTTIGTHVFRLAGEQEALYATAEQPRTAFSVLSTCQSVTMQVAVPGDNDALTAAISQEKADPQTIAVKPTQIATFTVQLVPNTTFSLLVWAGQNVDTYAYYNGTASCYTSSGRLDSN